MILFIGQVERGFIGRGAFQEVDYRRMFGGVAKWVTEIDSLERIPEIVSTAFSIARSGRPGPVVISLPEDVLFDTGGATDAAAVRIVQAAPNPAAMAELKRLLDSAKSRLWWWAERDGIGQQRRRCSASSSPMICLWPLRSGVRICSTIAMSTTWASSVSAPAQIDRAHARRRSPVGHRLASR